MRKSSQDAFLGFGTRLKQLAMIKNYFLIAWRNLWKNIKKVLGASVPRITSEIVKEFVKPVFIAAIIAIPLASIAMNKWLEEFAYRISIQWWVFVAAAAIALVIAVLTVGFQAIKAALSNPVKALRSE
jgi:putative ABC transport system permease protein